MGEVIKSWVIDGVIGHLGEPGTWAAVVMGAFMFAKAVWNGIVKRAVSSDAVQTGYLQSMSDRVGVLEKQQDDLRRAVSSCEERHNECENEVSVLRAEVEQLRGGYVGR